ncbi:MAG TPA: hypothetical protein VFU12_20715 [Glycomyces sp.]|nr:hypothetical protein [Glycomyces sp.]
MSTESENVDPEDTPPIVAASDCGSVEVVRSRTGTAVRLHQHSIRLPLRELEYLIIETYERAARQAAQADESGGAEEDYLDEMTALADLLHSSGPDAVIERYRSRFVSPEDEKASGFQPRVPPSPSGDHSGIDQAMAAAVSLMRQGRDMAGEEQTERSSARERTPEGDIELELALGETETLTYLRLSREALGRGAEGLGRAVTELIDRAGTAAMPTFDDAAERYPFLQGAEAMPQIQKDAELVNGHAAAQVADLDDLFKRVRGNGGT